MRRALLFLICALMLSCVREAKPEFGRCDEGLDRLAAWFEAPPMEYRPDSPLEPAGLIGPVKMCVDTTD